MNSVIRRADGCWLRSISSPETSNKSNSPGPRSFQSQHCTLRQKDIATGVEILWIKRKKAKPSPPPSPLPQSHFGSRTEDMKPDAWQQKCTALEMFIVQKFIFYQEVAGIFLKITRQKALWRINVWTRGGLHLPSVQIPEDPQRYLSSPYYFPTL